MLSYLEKYIPTHKLILGFDTFFIAIRIIDYKDKYGEFTSKYDICKKIQTLFNRMFSISLSTSYATVHAFN